MDQEKKEVEINELIEELMNQYPHQNIMDALDYLASSSLIEGKKESKHKYTT
ncbi:hypothetical protein [Bacillus sp. FJAT-22090]|uniref:hypothetical protein n=1 Tax=Bacillus sp. FJAT-22090 TaxID=1581038 RepID=UPI000ADC3438|nr:hypothetical protein [Bacillus sp. FJAT-22090]